MTTLYKLTSADGMPLHRGSGRWPLPTADAPGRWRSVRGPLVPCVNGLHLMRARDVLDWLRAGTLWEAEAGKERIDHGDKLVVRRARLVREAAVIDDRVLRTFAAACAERVLHIFEAARPGDDRPRLAIEAARLHAARAAAGAAAWAAAARAAAEAAAGAAEAAAAGAAEREWQSRRLCGLLGIAWEGGA